MNRMNNRIKLIILIVLISILTSSISVYATYTYFAKDVSYIKKDGTEITVEMALDELYKRKFSKSKVEELEKLTNGVACEGDYFYIDTPNSIEWNTIGVDNISYCKKIIYCHKIEGNNRNFEMTLPFNIDNTAYEVKLIKKTDNYGWNPVMIIYSGDKINIDVNYGTPEDGEYFFAILIK